MITFVDTNVLVYLFDADAPAKKKQALACFTELTLSGEMLLSAQVLQEFFVTVTRKLDTPLDTPLPLEQAEQVVSELATLPVVQTDTKLVLRAIARQRSIGLSFWDCLILEAALVGGAQRLLTEDLQHGQVVDHLRIENPFLDA